MPHVLLIEPNTVLGKVYTEALMQAGYSVAHATAAQAAIDSADARSPHVVVLELQLPAHSGIEFLHEFRSYSEWGKVPVIVHTLFAPPKLAPAREVLQQDLGVQRILYKPQTSLQLLLRAVREVLEEAAPR